MRPFQGKAGLPESSAGETVRDILIRATEDAIRSVDAARFFQTERGFHGRFYCTLQHQLERAGLIANNAILEMEYQKSQRHGTSQRPDIVFHIPAEYSHALVTENNFAVWALKRRARNLMPGQTLIDLMTCLRPSTISWDSLSTSTQQTQCCGATPVHTPTVSLLWQRGSLTPRF